MKEIELRVDTFVKELVWDIYFAFDENDSIVGIIDLRHELNDFLKDFGNSGYSVRPSMKYF